MGDMKKIIYIGDFVESYSTERYVAHGFRELGYEVICFQENKLMVQIGKEDEIADELISMNPEFILFSKGKPVGHATELIESLKKKGVTTVCWLFDLYFGLPGGREEKLRRKEAPYNSEWILSTDGGHQDEFKALGIKHVCLRQGIHEPEAILEASPKTKDVIFVGGDAFGTRKALLEGLETRYASRFERYGVPGYYVRGLPLNELYASTKVVVGDSQPWPYYWSNRIYETLGRGGFLIHPKVEGLDKEFTFDKHLVVYESLDELWEKIEYYLHHDKEREEIRLAGHLHVKQNYTYKHRCQELLDIIK